MSARKLAIYEDDTRSWHLIHAEALLTLAKLPEACLDALVTDPPYGIGIVGAHWDRASSSQAFERWTRAWAEQCLRVLKPGAHLIAFGAPRTFHRLTCAVEDAGLEIRDVVLWLYGQGIPKSRKLPGGRSTALKPAYEPILVARAPLSGTLTENLTCYGTGALNTDAARIEGSGFWPANIALTHGPDCPAAHIADPTSAASRLFYCAKATRAEREAGCEMLPVQEVPLYTGKRHAPRLVRNPHPTVKPTALMRWLIRLATPSDGLVLDPFCGSGTTGIAAVAEGRRFIGIEREHQYAEVACARLTHWAHSTDGQG